MIEWGLRLKSQPLQTPFGNGCDNRFFPHQKQPCCPYLCFRVSWHANFPTSFKSPLNCLYGHLLKISNKLCFPAIMENAEPQIPWSAGSRLFWLANHGQEAKPENGTLTTFFRQPENFFANWIFFNFFLTFFSRLKNHLLKLKKARLKP